MVVLEEIVKSNTTPNKNNSKNLTKRLNHLVKRTGYNIIQTNGQRIYAPPASKNIPSPPKGCEIFIGRLSKTIYEDELIPLFETIGPLYKFRMMLDFTERTRGYAFATYFNPNHADKAVEKFHNYELRPKLFIGVFKSVDNCRLFFGNIPFDKTRQDLLVEIKSLCTGVVDVLMFQDVKDPSRNRGFAFVEFDNHRYAAMARRQFTPNNLIIWNTILYVDWADPIPVVNPKIMSKVTILYLSNLPLDYSADDIKACICKYVSTQIITKVYKKLSYAFVHFNNRTSANYALVTLENFWIKDYKVIVEWARPRRFCKKYRWISPPENFCTSVPPALRKLIYTQKKSLLNKSSSRSPSYADSTINSSIPSTSYWEDSLLATSTSISESDFLMNNNDFTNSSSRCSSVTLTTDAFYDNTSDCASGATYVPEEKYLNKRFYSGYDKQVADYKHFSFANYYHRH